jgi:hypothetical protein
VGEILRFSGVEVIEFRASIVIGSGSLSFEMIRALVERLPMMITPRWVSVRSQPIAINDLLDYLLAALELPEADSSVFEIGGPDQVSYGDLMREYARQRGLRRIMIKVPVLSPRLSSLWLGLVTPLYARIGRKLIDSIRNPSVIRDHSASEVFNIRPMGVREAIEVALRNEDREFAETRWSDALSSLGTPPKLGGRPFRQPYRRCPHGSHRYASGSRICADSPYRGQYRLVLLELALAAARVDRPDCGGRRHEAAGICFTRFTSLSSPGCCAGSPKQLSGRQTDPSPTERPSPGRQGVRAVSAEAD